MGALTAFFEAVSGRQFSEGSQDEAKRAAANLALDCVEGGMTLGLGTGSTVEFFLQGLASRIRQGLDVRGIPTSSTTERRANELGIPLLGSPEFPVLTNHFCVDGADRVDVHGRLIKGGGGALLREKLVATYSERVCILVDPSKLKTTFDSTFAVPVECLPFGVCSSLAALAAFGCEVELRGSSVGHPLRTDNGNLVADCRFSSIAEPVELERQMLALPGVVEVGIFSGLLDLLVVGFPDGTAEQWPDV